MLDNILSLTQNPKMKGIPTLLLIFFASLLFSQPANLQWVKQMGAYADVRANDIAVDDSGNVYTVGWFLVGGDFDPGPGTYSLSATPGYNVFISKLDSSGKFLWARAVAGTAGSAYVYGRSIALDDVGSVYISGRFSGTVDFDPGPLTHSKTVASYEEAYILKLDHTGAFVWVQTLAANGVAVDANAITVDGIGNVYITGYAGTSIFVSKYTNIGSLSWTQTMVGDSAYTTGNSIAVGKSGNVYVIGNFYGTVDFDPGANTHTISAKKRNDIFITKLNVAGNLVWVKCFAGSGYEWGSGIVLDGSENVYSTGQFASAIDFDPGPGIFYMWGECFILKLDSASNFKWARNLGGGAGGAAIDVDSHGNVYTCGSFSGRTHFYAGKQIFPLISEPYLDVFIIKSDSLGDLGWIKQLGGEKHDHAISIAVDKNGNIYTTGYFNTTADFDPGPGTYTLTSPVFTGTYTTYNSDVFVHKMSNCSPSQSMSIVSSTNMLCRGDSALLTASGAASFTWGAGQNTSSFYVKPEYNALYQVWGTDVNGCENSVSIVQNVTVCVNTSLQENEQKNYCLFPNPGSGQFRLEGDLESKIVTYSLTDLNGKVLESGTMEIKEETFFDFSKNGYRGLYFLNLKVNDTSSTFKVIID
jgi:hypothetical protein